MRTSGQTRTPHCKHRWGFIGGTGCTHSYLWSLYLTLSHHCQSWHLEQWTESEETNRTEKKKRLGFYTWDTNSSGPYSVHPFFHPPLMIWNSAPVRRKLFLAFGSHYPRLIIIHDELLVTEEEWKLLLHPVTCVVNKIKHMKHIL